MNILDIQKTVNEYHYQQGVCQGCGEAVTRVFVQVFGTTDGSLHGCTSCSPSGDIRDGGGKQLSQ